MKKLLFISILFFGGVYFIHTNLLAGFYDYDTSNPKAVFSVYIDENGNKWFGTTVGLSMYDGETWAHYTKPNFIQGDKVLDIEPEFTDYGSEIWLATDYGSTVAAYNIDGISSATTYTTESGLLNNTINSVAVDTGHTKYFGMDEGVSVFSKSKWDTINYDRYPENIPQGVINDLATHNNLLYVATSGGIGRFSMEVDGISGASRWTSEYGITPLSENITTVYVDDEGDQWFGTDAGAEKHLGLSAKENWLLYTTNEGLVNNYINSITEDTAGAIWFGTNGGVSKFVNNEFINYTTTDGLLSDTVYDIDFDIDGSIWFATNNGINRLDNGVFEGITTNIINHKSSLPCLKIQQIYQNQLLITYNSLPNNNAKVFLYNISGKLIQSTVIYPTNNKVNTYIWNINTQKPGIYIVRLMQSNLTNSQKIIIK